MSDLRILLVDDEAAFRRTTKKLLEKRGYFVDTAEDGVVALEKIDQQPFHLVLLDVKMPRMDGITVLKKIKRDHPEIEIILLTAHGTVENAVEGVKLGATHYLMKPADLDDIVESIELSRARKELSVDHAVVRNERFQKGRWSFFLPVAAFFFVPTCMLLLLGYLQFNTFCASASASGSAFSPAGRLCTNLNRTAILSGAILTTMLVMSWFGTGRLIAAARSFAEKRDDWEFQRLHASKLASIENLASGIAHEINNPLAIVVARCGMISDMINPEFHPEPDMKQIAEELNTISQAAFRARQVTRQLIEFGHRKRTAPAPCRVSTLLDETVEALQEKEEPNAVLIRRTYDPDLPSLTLDADQIKQVFSYLLKNAKEAVSDSGTISIRTRKNKNFVDVIIEDNGVGMNPEEMQKCFDPFFTTKKIGLATGLSLSIALSIVESHGGTIDVQSNPGEGSLFTVSLPITASAGAAR